MGPLKRVHLADHLIGFNLAQMEDLIRRVIRKSNQQSSQARISVVINHALQELANNKDLETA